MSSFIRPSRRGWLVMANAIVWYLIARVNHNLVTLFLAWGSLALLLASFANAFLALRKLRLRRLPCEDAQVGHLFSLPILCDNLAWWRRQPLVLCEELPFADRRSTTTPFDEIPPWSSREIARTVMPVRRGEFRLDAVTIRDTDPAGIFLRERQFSAPGTLLVLPAFFPIQNLDLPPKETFTLSAATNPAALSGNSQDFYGVREYHPTDGMRHIHWKSSAKYRRFMVREYERSATLPVAILLDGHAAHLASPNGSNMECAVSLAASVVQHLKDVPCNIAFAAGGDGVLWQPPQPSPRVIHPIMHLLATVRPGDTAFESAVNALLQSIAPGTIIFCFTLADDQPTADAIGQLLARGFDVRWFVTAKEDFTPKKARRGKSPEHRASLARRILPSMTPEQIFQPADDTAQSAPAQGDFPATPHPNTVSTHRAATT